MTKRKTNKTTAPEDRIVNFPFILRPHERLALKKLALERDWTVQQLIRTAINDWTGKNTLHVNK